MHLMIGVVGIAATLVFNKGKAISERSVDKLPK